MKSITKFTALQHGINDQTNIPAKLLKDLNRDNSELRGILLCKQGISSNESSIHICKMCFHSSKHNKLPKFSLANRTWIGCVLSNLPKLTMVEETLIAQYCCRVLLIKLRYSNNSFTGQCALKGNIVSFAQNLEIALQLINTLPISLEALSDVVVVHFIGDKHPSMNIIKSYKLLYVRRLVVQTWLTWLQANYVGYTNLSIDIDNLNRLPENNIRPSILRSIFKSAMSI